MIRLLTLIFVAVMTASSAFASGAPKIKLAEKSFDFGTIREADGEVSHDFVIENIGDSPLIITSASASCGCTTPLIPKEPVKKGEKATIRVTYNPAGRPGEFSKDITVRSNAKPSKFKLKITGTVLPKSNQKSK